MEKPPKPLEAARVADREIWARYVQHVRPLSGRAVPVLPEAPPPAMPPAVGMPAIPLPPRARILAELRIDAPPPGLDRSTWMRLKSGKIAPDRKLDLHGMTAARGHHAVLAVLTEAARGGLRCVEIVTGRGSGESGGVLRRELPFWLNLPELRPLILAVSYPHAANQGAVRVLLRRMR